VTGIFRQKNSSNTLLLLVYALALKFPIFMHPVGPLVQEEDNFLFTILIQFLRGLHLPNLVYSFLSFLLLFVQASIFNRICNNNKMLARPNYLPAMSYILITSLMKEWSLFSAPLLVNTMLIALFYRMIELYNSNKAVTAIFNIGFVMGVTTLLYKPAILFILLIWLALFIMRPFAIREWLLGLLGVTTPYYFLGIILFLNNQFAWTKILPIIHFTLPVLPNSVTITLSILLLMLGFVIGGFYVQNNLNKMLIQVRKNWSLLLLYLMVAALMLLTNGKENYVSWLLFAVPLSAFHASAYFYPNNKTFPMVLQWNIFAFAIYINYMT